jgi:hypothetical protein
MALGVGERCNELVTEVSVLNVIGGQLILERFPQLKDKLHFPPHLVARVFSRERSTWRANLDVTEADRRVNGNE